MLDFNWWEIIKIAWAVLPPVVGAIFGWAMWSFKQTYVKKSDCSQRRKEIGAKLCDHDKWDLKIQGLPSDKAVNSLEKTLAGLTTELRVLGESVKGQEKLLSRVEEQVKNMDGFLRWERK